eukprot:3065764-Prymnesium_polylepis.1
MSSAESECKGAKLAMDAQLFQPGVNGGYFGLNSVQLGRDMTLTVQFRRVGVHRACVASTGGLSPLGDFEFRPTSALVLVVANETPPPALPAPLMPDRPPPTAPLFISKPPPQPSAPATLGSTMLLLLILLLAVGMVRSKLLTNPLFQMLPVALGVVDLVTDISFVLLCYEKQDFLITKGQSFIPLLAI